MAGKKSTEMPKRFKSGAMEAIHETMDDLRKIGAIEPSEMEHFDQACLVTGKAAGSHKTTALRFVLFKDAEEAWRWRLVAGNGQIVATSGEAYKRKKDCLSAINLVRHASDAELVA